MIGWRGPLNKERGKVTSKRKVDLGVTTWKMMLLLMMMVMMMVMMVMMMMMMTKTTRAWVKAMQKGAMVTKKREVIPTILIVTHFIALELKNYF